MCDAVMFLCALIYAIIFVRFRSNDLTVCNGLSIKNWQYSLSMRGLALIQIIESILFNKQASKAKREKLGIEKKMPSCK